MPKSTEQPSFFENQSEDLTWKPLRFYGVRDQNKRKKESPSVRWDDFRDLCTQLGAKFGDGYGVNVYTSDRVRFQQVSQTIRKYAVSYLEGASRSIVETTAKRQVARIVYCLFQARRYVLKPKALKLRKNTTPSKQKESFRVAFSSDLYECNTAEDRLRVINHYCSEVFWTLDKDSKEPGRDSMRKVKDFRRKCEDTDPNDSYEAARKFILGEM